MLSEPAAHDRLNDRATPAINASQLSLWINQSIAPEMSTETACVVPKNDTGRFYVPRRRNNYAEVGRELVGMAPDGGAPGGVPSPPPGAAGASPPVGWVFGSTLAVSETW